MPTKPVCGWCSGDQFHVATSIPGVVTVDCLNPLCKNLATASTLAEAWLEIQEPPAPSPATVAQDPEAPLPC